MLRKRLKLIYQRDNLQAILKVHWQLYEITSKDREDLDEQFQDFEVLFVRLESLRSPD